ncbi:hypothetical protein Aduo_009745 [Ancylostoma duodenale]
MNSMNRSLTAISLLPTKKSRKTTKFHDNNKDNTEMTTKTAEFFAVGRVSVALRPSPLGRALQDSQRQCRMCGETCDKECGGGAVSKIAAAMKKPRGRVCTFADEFADGKASRPR